MFFLLGLLKTSIFIRLYQKDEEENRRLVFLYMILVLTFLLSLADYALPDKIFIARRNIYTVLSIVYFVDSMYFYHYHTLPSLNEIPMLLLAGDGAKESILSMLLSQRLFFIFDLPLLFIFQRQIEKVDMAFYAFRISLFPKGVTYWILFCFIIYLGVLYTLKKIFILRNRDLMTFHLRDVKSIVFREPKNPLKNSELKKYWHTGIPNEMTGKAKNKNLLVIQMESVQNIVIQRTYNGQEITPNLNRLIQSSGSIYFSNYYQSIGKGNTADAEFTSNHSLYPALDFPSYFRFTHNDFFGLPRKLKDEHYDTMVFHGNRKNFYNRDKMYPLMGFEKYYSLECFENPKIIGLGMDDKDLFQRITKILKEKVKRKELFYSFVITITSHHPYLLPKELQTLTLLPEDEDTILGNYLQAVHYVDEALGEWIEELKKEGILDHTLLALYGDHYGISALKEEEEQSMERFIKKPYNLSEMMNIPLILHFPEDFPAQKNKKVGCQMDFMPTMLNLFSLNHQESLYFGGDLFDSSRRSFIAPVSYVMPGSFITDEGAFFLETDLQVENGWFIPFDHQELSMKMRHLLVERALKEVEDSLAILENRQETMPPKRKSDVY